MAFADPLQATMTHLDEPAEFEEQPPSDRGDGGAELASQRLDKWLWAARFFKTRSLAAAAVTGGKVHVDGQRVKPAKSIRAGALLSIRRGPARFDVVVQALARQRGPARAAAALYEELPESVARRAAETEARRAAARERAQWGGRPSKRDRRRLSALKEERDGDAWDE